MVKLGAKNKIPKTMIFLMLSFLNPLAKYIIEITNTAAHSK